MMEQSERKRTLPGGNANARRAETMSEYLAADKMPPFLLAAADEKARMAIENAFKEIASVG